MNEFSRHLIVLGALRHQRLLAAAVHETAALAAASLEHPDPGLAAQLARITFPPTHLPFVRPGVATLPSLEGPCLLRIDDLDKAFPNNQLTGTRLVLTQSTYLIQKWVDTLGPTGRIIATATREALLLGAPEALEGRGPWARFEVVELESEPPGGGASRQGGAENQAEESSKRAAGPKRGSNLESDLAAAFASPSGEERLEICRRLFGQSPKSAVAAVAFASAAREQQDLSAARTALDAAGLLAPEWEAVHYEDGKFWLGCEELDRARAAFERAAELMPTFSAAYVNLGATLGELGRPEDAMRAFTHALAGDPRNFTLLNNMGVVNRELGRLDESEAALNKVVQIAPDFVFGHYNLGHTRLLKGNQRGALEAYEEGQRRDPEKNRRQGCRLAVVRFANGDPVGAERDLWHYAGGAPPDEREDMLLEAYEIGQALVQVRPELAAHRAFLDRIVASLGGPRD
jgi:tetratricopeptide (TPR) repeat protein